MRLRHFLGALAALALLLSPAVGAQSLGGVSEDLILTGVADGPLPGGLPKALEFYATADIADLSAYGFAIASNGTGSDGAPEFTFPADGATAGDFIYVTTDAMAFSDFFGFAADYDGAPVFINGDDAVELYSSGVVIDVFGDVNVDGSGEAWEYQDGWGYRANGTGPDGSTFEVGNWSYSGVNGLEGGTDNDTADMPFPAGTYQAMMADGATVAFSAATGTAEEGGTVTVDVVLSITGTAPTGDIVVDITPTDDPDASVDMATLTFTSPMDGDSQTVTLTATDDMEAEADEIVSFSLAVTSGDATVGAPGSFAFTVTDNDTAQMVTLAEARALGPDAFVQVSGTVSRAMGAFTYIQDMTGGLAIRQTGGPFRDDVESGAIAPGTELTLTGTLSEFRELLQINGGDLAEYSIDGQGDAPDPQVVSLIELADNGEQYESELVFLTGLTIDEGEDVLFDDRTNYDVTDDTDDSNAVVVRIGSADDTMIDGTAIPPDPITVIGVVGQFSTDDPAVGYQILPIQRSDVVGTEGDPADVQVIHNSPDPAAEVVDVYIDGVLILDDLAFQTGTPFVNLPTGIALDIAVAPGSSTSVDDAVFTTSVALTAGRNYQIIAQGVLDPSQFAANPDGTSTEFTLAVTNRARKRAVEFPLNTEVRFYHGTPDAPAVDIRVGAVAQSIVFNDVAFSEFSPRYTPLAPQLTRLEVTNADGTVSFGRAELDLGGRGGEAGLLLASGFADPSANQDGAPLSLLIVFADGTTEVDAVGVAGEGTADLSELALATPAPNPVSGTTRIAYTMPQPGAVTVSVYDALGRRVATLVDGEVAADRHVATLDARDLAAGVYLVRLQTEAGTVQQTFTVVR